MLKLVPSSRVHVSGRTESEKASSSHPATPLPKDWSMWSSDGRVMPPAGLYRVTFIGTAPAVRRSNGWEYPPNGSVIKTVAGDAIVPKESANYTLILEQLVAETAPPCGLGLLTALLRRCGHGAKTRQYSRPDRVHPHGQWRCVGHPVSVPRAVGREWLEYSPGPWPLPHRHGRCALRNDLQRVTMGIHGGASNPHRLPRNPRIRHTSLLQGQRHRLHHTPRLITVGGGA